MAITKAIQDFSIYAGDGKRLVVTVTDGDGLPVNLAGSTVRWVLARRPDMHLKVIRKDNKSQGGVEITGANEFTVILEPTDTEALVGIMYHQARVKTDSMIYTVLNGIARISASNSGNEE